MTELNNGLLYRSQNEGAPVWPRWPHGHAAGAATLLSKRKHKLPSNTKVRLLFQPAEEGPARGAHDCGWVPRGGGRMLRLPQLAILQAKPDAHQSRPLMAHPSTFTIVVTGRAWFPASARSRPGAHGLAPRRGAAVDCVAQRGVLRAGRRHGHHDPRRRGLQRHPRPGEDRNRLSLISILTLTEPPNCGLDAVTLKGRSVTCRRPCARRSIHGCAIASGVCATYGATGTVEFDSMYPVIDNLPSRRGRLEARRLLGEDAVRAKGCR